MRWEQQCFPTVRCLLMIIREAIIADIFNMGASKITDKQTAQH
jgi:hypothetical protein